MDPEEQALLQKAGRNGWTITGRTPETESVTGRDENNQSVTTTRPTGNIVWTITDGNGHNQQMTVSAGVPNQNAGDIVKPPADLAAGSKPATPAGGLERLDAKGNPIPPGATTPAVYLRDPNAPPGTPPFKVEGDLKTDPSGWTPINDPNDPTRVIGLWDPVNNKVGASVPGSTTAKPSGQFTNVIDPNDPTGKRVIGLIDTGDKSLHAVSTTADGKQIVTTPTAIYSFDKDTNKLDKLTDIDKNSPFQVVTYPDGTIYRFDPNDGSLTPLSTGPAKSITSNGTTYVYNADKGTYELPPGITKAATVNNSTTLKTLDFYDDQGNLIASHPNPNYTAPAVNPPPANANARMIAIPDPDNPSQLKWVPNEGRITASDALKQLATQLTGHVVAGDIGQDEAIALINAANSKQTNDINAQQNATTAAGDVLTNARGNATTGAGLLQQRVQAATGTLQSILGNVLGNKNFGAGGGVPSNIGENLVQGLSGWTAELMGGQSTMDSAARMVQAADPNSSMADPNTQAAVATLGQMLDKYKQLNGGVPHPLHAAADAAVQAGQNGGIAAPMTTAAFDPQASTAALNAQGFHDTPEGRAAAQAAGQGALLQRAAPVTVPTPAVSAVQATPGVSAIAPINAVPGQNYGASIAYQPGWYPGMGAIPQPLPQFVAPVTS